MMLLKMQMQGGGSGGHKRAGKIKKNTQVNEVYSQ
jgi:hypothetical protein